MRTKLLTTLVVDNDPDQLKQLTKVLSEVFNSVYTTNIDSAVTDHKNLKPHVIFINLTIKQRRNNLELLEKLKSTEENPVIIFGYNEGLEPELTAHALEIGMHDIFLRPFDADIIASKINLFFKSDKAMDKGISYSKLTQPIESRVSLKAKMIGVDESGLTFSGPHYINKGSVLTMNQPLIKEIFEKDSIDMLVTKTWLSDDWKVHFFFLEPKNANEQSSAALRRFILKKTS